MTLDNGKERIIRPKRCGVTTKVGLENPSSIAHIGLQKLERTLYIEDGR